MKRIASILAALCICLFTCLLLTACGNEEHTHIYKTDWSKDTAHHWHACEGEGCSDITEKSEHIWNDGEITTEATAEADGVRTFTCTVCGQTKAEAIKYSPDQNVSVDTDHIFALNPHRGTLTVNVRDEKGRLTEIWHVDDTLESRYPFLVPSYSFKYNTDGYLSYYKGSTVESEIAYKSDGTPYFVDSKTPTASFSLSSVSYHENGSVKSIAFYFDDQLQTDVYDESGRIILKAWENSDGTDGAYNSSYEDNKQIVTMIQNDALFDAQIEIEYNTDGYPLNQTTRMGDTVSVNKEWIYDGKMLVSIKDYDSSETVDLTYDNNGLLIKKETKEEDEVTEYTVFTYNDIGLRLTEKKYDAQNNYQQGYTYDYTGKERKTVTKEQIEDSEQITRLVSVYDAYGNILTDTSFSEWISEDKDGKSKKFYGESFIAFDSEGRIVLMIDTSYKDVDGVKTKWNVYTYRSDYDIPADANYEWVRMDSREYYFDAPHGINGLEGEDMYLIEVHYGKKGVGGDIWVNELTGEPLPGGSDGWKDNYGNYYEMIDGEHTNTIIYYQKYCDSNGNFWYFTADGIKTPLV